MTEQEKQDDYQKRLNLVRAMTTVDTEENKKKSSPGYMKAYVWSVLIPPIGIYYFIKFVFFTEGAEGNVMAGIISFFLTIFSFFLSVWMLGVYLKQSTSSIPLQELKTLENLIRPENQKQILDLFK
jgi:hypothetical protein